MRPYDYIEYSDVMALTDTEYESLLNYIKFIGFRVLRLAYESGGSYYNLALLLDEDGYLVWFPKEWLGDNGSRVPIEEVKRMTALGMVV